MINDLCVDIGFQSLNKLGEQLCGDHVEVIHQDENCTVIVLADGLGSGVKASILSTLTSKIIATMVSAGMDLTDCVDTIIQTLPVCSLRGVAYSTFSLIKIINNLEAEIVQYDNPKTILLRNGVNFELPYKEKIIKDKTILTCKIKLQENDVFVLLSDGVTYAGVGETLNFGWQREDIINFIEPLCLGEYTAKTLSTILLNECDSLYQNKPGDDTTVCAVKIRKREPMNIAFGPPSDRNDCDKMMSLFFSKKGKHIVCGGTTSTIVSDYLNKSMIASLETDNLEIPPIAYIDGVDLVTEGVITMNKVVEYAKNYLDENDDYKQWLFMKNGASQIARLLFEEATDINFYVGRAINPAHQNPDLPINFSIKMNLVEELSESLRKMGKRIKISYF